MHFFALPLSLLSLCFQNLQGHKCYPRISVTFFVIVLFFHSKPCMYNYQMLLNRQSVKIVDNIWIRVRIRLKRLNWCEKVLRFSTCHDAKMLKCYGLVCCTMWIQFTFRAHWGEYCESSFWEFRYLPCGKFVDDLCAGLCVIHIHTLCMAYSIGQRTLIIYISAIECTNIRSHCGTIMHFIWD